MELSERTLTASERFNTHIDPSEPGKESLWIEKHWDSPSRIRIRKSHRCFQSLCVGQALWVMLFNGIKNLYITHYTCIRPNLIIPAESEVGKRTWSSSCWQRMPKLPCSFWVHRSCGRPDHINLSPHESKLLPERRGKRGASTDLDVLFYATQVIGAVN